MSKLVYVIDDDQDLRDVLSFALESDGYEVITFANALTAFHTLESLSEAHLPSLIFVDYLMPDLDGISFVKMMKSSTELLKRIPLVMNSAMGGLELMPEIPDDVLHLNKPMDLDELLAMTKSHCI
jgi:two-component system alkaline phosphatase synthesis response regulator PhoP